jgi:phage tail sheath gpL-like
MVSTAVDASAVARVVGIKTEFRDLRGGRAVLLPQRIAVIGQGATSSVYSTDKTRVTSANQAGQLFGYGSPVHLAVRQLLPLSGDGVGTIPVTVYPLVDDASGVAAAGDVTPSGTATEAASYVLRIGGIRSDSFVIDTTDAVADMIDKMVTAVNAVPEMPVTAVDGTTQLDLTAKWEGASGNDITIEVLGSTTAGITFALTQPTGGLVNPDVQPALDQIGDVWETLLLNCMDIADTVTLDKYSTFGEGRWGALTRKPLIAFTGNTEVSANTAITVTDARKTDRTNVQLVAPGSTSLPFTVAARQLARIAKVANNNPARNYGSQQATGLIPGADGDQWLYNDRDLAVKGGSSTSTVRDAVVTIGDVVTMYHPSGDPLPAYRQVVDIIKLMNTIFNFDLEFVSTKWDGMPLIPDGQPTINPDARTPIAVQAAIAAIVDGLANEAILSDPASIKASIITEIDSQNPKRLNASVTVRLSGNVDIISVDLDFGFYFG